MHDIKGRKIQKNDIVMSHDQHYLGRGIYKVAACHASSDTCNITAAPLEFIGSAQTLTAKECEIVLKHDGSLPEAAV